MIQPIVRRQDDTGPAITIGYDQDMTDWDAVLRVTLPDETTEDYIGVISGTTITFEVTAGMTETIGRYPVRLVLTTDLGEIISLPRNESWYLEIVKFGE